MFFGLGVGRLPLPADGIGAGRERGRNRPSRLVGTLRSQDFPSDFVKTAHVPLPICGTLLLEEGVQLEALQEWYRYDDVTPGTPVPSEPF